MTPPAILYSLPARTEYTYSKDKYEKVPHQGVWSLQYSLYQLNPSLGFSFADGYFGPNTELIVKRYQANRGLMADGVAGPATQKRIIVGWKNSATDEVDVKPNLLDGFLESEGGWLLAPVNWSVPGGVDTGAVQNRVYDISGLHGGWTLSGGVPTDTLLAQVVFDANKVMEALDTKSTILKLATDLRSRRNAYFKGTNAAGNTIYPYTKASDRRSWEMASLYHNWPYAADLLAKGGTLPDKDAPWIPASVRATGVTTYSDWATYYVSKVTKYVQW